MSKDPDMMGQVAQLPFGITEEAVALVGPHLRGFAQPIAVLPKLVISVGQALAKRDEEIDRAGDAERSRCLAILERLSVPTLGSASLWDRGYLAACGEIRRAIEASTDPEHSTPTGE